MMPLPPLEELSLLQRIALAVGIVVFALIVLAFVSWLSNATAAPQPPPDAPLYGDIASDRALLLLDKHALSEAYEDQIRHLFSIWVKGQAKSATEITNGIRIARQAYGMANKQIEQREHGQQ